MAINGTTSPLFRSTKGLKQGNPLSPFLFILIVVVLSLMIKRAADLNLLFGFKPSSEAFEINHLQFADDLIVFLDDSCKQVNNLKNVLLGFEHVSGLRVNFQKSALVSVGEAVNAMEGAVIFGCSITTFPMKYLEIPLGSKSKAVGVWDVILQNFQKKLISVEKQMERIMRQFLWGSIKKKPRRGWVGWTKVNLPKEGGGAGPCVAKYAYPSAEWRYMPFLERCLVEWSLKESEIEDIAHLLDMLSTFNCGVGNDHRVWQNGEKRFSVKECYKSLEEDGSLIFPYKCVWNPKIPQKVIFFVWSLCYNVAPTMDYLRNYFNVNGCLLFTKSAETNNHLLLHCEKTRELWNYFMEGYGLQWVFQNDVIRNTIWEWRRKKGRNINLRSKFWDIIPFAIWWAVWLE
ncbi:uncharacterized protein LOC113351892 [Papaver somniferum]|uniref:uncharacterized protein LOC113351892 n=1 Tax=Papaver somniferum TaxID=3469 RepID=UPI000E6FA9BA|nr:uncharacterized protein LOC113351892 [Papaver somniferum]